jgi:hypothetical protein
MPSTESWILEGRQSNELYSMVHPIPFIYLSIILFCSTHTLEYPAFQKSQMSVCCQLYTRNHPEIPNNTKNQNSEQKEIRIHTERSQQQKSNNNRKNLLVNCVFIFAYDNNCLYWIENKLFLFIYFIYLFIKIDHIFFHTACMQYSGRISLAYSLFIFYTVDTSLLLFSAQDIEVPHSGGLFLSAFVPWVLEWISLCF